MVIDDLIVLGRACPDLIKGDRPSVCLAGWSEKHGFIRIYPTHPFSLIKRWNIIRVEVERNPQDSRHESWKIVGSKREWDKLHTRIEVVGVAPKQCYGVIDGCVSQINERKDSLGIIAPTSVCGYWQEKEQLTDAEQLFLFQIEQAQNVKTKRDFDFVPRARFRCSGCQSQNPHDQQLLEWGVWRWLEKHPDKKEQVWENLHFGDEEYETFFFVGNQAKYRNSFMVISVLRWKRNPQLYLF